MSEKFTSVLAELREELPTRYANELSDIINNDSTKPKEIMFNADKVRNVFNGKIQDLQSISMVIGAAKKYIAKQQKVMNTAKDLVSA